MIMIIAGLLCVLFRRLLRLRARDDGCPAVWRRSRLSSGQQGHQDVAFHARMVSIWPWSPISISKRSSWRGPLPGAPFRARDEKSCAHFVASREADDLALANLIVVLSGGGPKLDFLQLRNRGCSCAAREPFVGLIEIFAVVGDLTNGRIGRGEISTRSSPFPWPALCFKRLHDAELAALFINHPDLARPYSFVNANNGRSAGSCFAISPPQALVIRARKRRQATVFAGRS